MSKKPIPTIPVVCSKNKSHHFAFRKLYSPSIDLAGSELVDERNETLIERFLDRIVGSGCDSVEEISEILNAPHISNKLIEIEDDDPFVGRPTNSRDVLSLIMGELYCDSYFIIKDKK